MLSYGNNFYNSVQHLSPNEKLMH